MIAKPLRAKPDGAFLFPATMTRNSTITCHSGCCPLGGIRDREKVLLSRVKERRRYYVNSYTLMRQSMRIDAKDEINLFDKNRCSLYSRY